MPGAHEKGGVPKHPSSRTSTSTSTGRWTGYFDYSEVPGTADADDARRQDVVDPEIVAAEVLLEHRVIDEGELGKALHGAMKKFKSAWKAPE